MSGADRSAPRRRGRPPASEARDTREQLLAAALDLFAAHGFAGTSVRAIARSAGLSEAGLYAHFSGKQALYDELFGRAGPVSLAALELDAAELAAERPETAVPSVVDALMGLWETPRAMAFASVLLREGVPGTPGSGLAEAVAEARHALEPLFQAWSARGAFRPGLDTATLVWELFTPLFAVRFLHLHAGADAEDRAIGRRLATRHVEFFLGSVLAGHSRTENGESDD